jgi:ABC-type nitrate/sulfonate/bicarbonate transport system substrate-binding protein
MIAQRWMFCSILAAVFGVTALTFAQEKKLDRIRVGGGSASATQMSLWLAKEAGYYEKHGLNVEVIIIQGSSLAIQAMLSGELPIIQAGGAGPVQAARPGLASILLTKSVLDDNGRTGSPDAVSFGLCISSER